MSAGYVYILGAPLPVKGAFKCHYTYRRGLLRCSFRQQWAVQSLRSVGRVTGPMGQEAELSLISYFGRYEVIDEIDNNLHMAEDKSAEEM